MAKEKEYVYVEAANGMTARIPRDRLKQWQEGQERLKRGEGLEETERFANEMLEIFKDPSSRLERE